MTFTMFFQDSAAILAARGHLARRPWMTNEKLQLALMKATTGIEKSFKLLV